jgi:hypothetical protein
LEKGQSLRHQEGASVVNSAQYDASVLDMDRLNSFVQKVARTTRKPMAPPISYLVSETVLESETTRGLFGLGRREVQISRTVQKNVELVGPHWLLERRHWHLRDAWKVQGARLEEEQHEQIYLVLLPTGTMLRAWTSEHTVLSTGGPTASGLIHQEQNGSSHTLTQADVIELDFEKRYAERTWRRDGHEFTGWGDRDPGKKLIRHAKGVGLSMVLRGLLDEG